MIRRGVWGVPLRHTPHEKPKSEKKSKIPKTSRRLGLRYFIFLKVSVGHSEINSDEPHERKP